MEEKNTEKNPEAKKHYHHRRRRPQNNNGGQGNNNAEKKTSEQKGHGNGGYTKANQNPNRSKNKTNHGDKTRHTEKSRPRKKGYQPDTGKDAIRTFVLGTHEEDSLFYVFSFDRGTYSIHKGAVPVIPEPAESEETDVPLETEEGEGSAPETGSVSEAPLPPRKEDYFDRENAEELLVSRDKVLAYQTWNELKRPKKGRGQKPEPREE